MILLALALATVAAPAPIAKRVIDHGQVWWISKGNGHYCGVPDHKLPIKGIPDYYLLQSYIDDQATCGLRKIIIPTGTYHLDVKVWFSDCGYFAKGAMIVAAQDGRISIGRCRENWRKK